MLLVGLNLIMVFFALLCCEAVRLYFDASCWFEFDYDAFCFAFMLKITEPHKLHE